MEKDKPNHKPAKLTLAAIGAAFWAVTFGAFRDFVWADLRDGSISLRGLPRLTRAIIIMGFCLLLIMVIVMLSGDMLRQIFPLVTMPNSLVFAPGRGVLVPIVLLPLALLFIAIAWSFALAGAVHSHFVIRVGVLFLFMITAVRQIEGVIISVFVGYTSLMDIVILVVAVLSVLFIFLFFIVVGFLRPRPAFEFVVFFVFVALTFFAIQIKNQWDARLLDVPLGLAYLQMNIKDFWTIVFIFIMHIGVDIADFVRQSTSWLMETLTERLPDWIPGTAFFLLASWRMVQLVLEAAARLRKNTVGQELLVYAGALGVPALVWIVWLVIRYLQRNRQSEVIDNDTIARAVQKRAILLILAVNLLSLVVFIVIEISTAILIPMFIEFISDLSMVVNEFTITWAIMVSCGAFGLSLFLARRGKRALPLYLGIYSVLHLYRELTQPEGFLHILHWEGPHPVDFWWVFLFLVLGVVLLLRRRLTDERAGMLFFLIFITFLLRQTNFIEDPFSPFFGFAGVVYIAFGIVWDAATSGSWANRSTAALSRTSRLFLYLGYVILMVTVMNWTLVTHDVFSLDLLTGDLAMKTFNRFGLPMLYAIFAYNIGELTATN